MIIVMMIVIIMIIIIISHARMYILTFLLEARRRPIMQHDETYHKFRDSKTVVLMLKNIDVNIYQVYQ